jgi:hypothetical protein
MSSFIICTSSNIIRVIKSRRISWAGHVARMREMISKYKILVGIPEENGVDCMITVKWILMK